MRKNTLMGAALVATGVSSAVAAVNAGDHGARTPAVAASLLSGACTALGVTSVLVGWADRRPAEDTER